MITASFLFFPHLQDGKKPREFQTNFKNSLLHFHIFVAFQFYSHEGYLGHFMEQVLEGYFETCQISLIEIAPVMDVAF